MYIFSEDFSHLAQWAQQSINRYILSVDILHLAQWAQLSKNRFILSVDILHLALIPSPQTRMV